ncbi:hypothetical protein BU15DRAFT_59247 [Melanogaster broomeanus]|nr:hypothetical protein BU15DRAFT_59247 [Melanogaster broomeanus]
MSVPPEFSNSLLIRKSLFFAGHSLLVYDYLLTFSRERFKVEYVWGAPWTVVKATFLFNRYGNLVGQSIIVLEETGGLSHGSKEICGRFNLFAGIFVIFPAASIHILVLMRSWAIWGCTYRLAVLLILSYVVYTLVVIGMMVYVANTENFVDFQYLDEIGVCVVPMPPFSVVSPALSDSQRHLRPLQNSLAVVTIGLTALQASVYNNLFTIICCCLDRKQDPRNQLALALSFPLLSIVGQRLVLNLRGFQTRHYTTRDLSREVNRQMAAMGGTSFWGAVDQRNSVHDGNPPGQEWSESSRAMPMTDVELKDVLPSDDGVRPPTTEEIYEVVRADEECVCSRSYLQNNE